MSAIKAKLQDDIKTAMKARDQERLTNLRGLSSAIKQVEIDTRKELEDPEVQAILQKEIKKRKDALQFAEQANREDLIAQNKGEIALIQGYLGEQYSDEKLGSLIKELIAGGADNLGKIMGELNKTHRGKFDGKSASELAKNLLGQ